MKIKCIYSVIICSFVFINSNAAAVTDSIPSRNVNETYSDSCGFTGKYTMEELRAIHDSLKEKIIITEQERAFITKQADRVRDKFPDFERLLVEWNEAWAWTFSSNTYTARSLPQYAVLKSMGPDLIPLLIEKMAESEQNFYILPLYEDLQADVEQKAVYEPGDSRRFESEQQRSQRTVRKWLSAAMG